MHCRDFWHFAEDFPGRVAIGAEPSIGGLHYKNSPISQGNSGRLRYLDKGGTVLANPKGKKKFLLWIYPNTQELVKNNYRKDHCKSQSEFIERAIQYYVGRVNAEDDTS